MPDQPTNSLLDRLDPARANALLTALDQPDQLTRGDALPPFFHHLYFWDVHPAGDLGRDGHPKTGLGLIPDMGLPRRMWAGGRLTFHAPLQADHIAEKRSKVAKITQKNGRTGPLAFVSLEHHVFQNGTLCVQERQDLVYRQDPDISAAKPTPPTAPMGQVITDPFQFNSTLLFRYSALTFNGHRIHYDLDYAQQVEGYDGLVVHGPLLAQQVMLWLQATVAPLKTFDFRATAPLMHFESAQFHRTDNRAWVSGPDGRLCMQAEFTV